MVKTDNVHNLAFFIFYESEAFPRVLKSYLLRSPSPVPIEKCDLVIHSGYIIDKRVTGTIKAQC